MRDEKRMFVCNEVCTTLVVYLEFSASYEITETAALKIVKKNSKHFVQRRKFEETF